MNKKTELYSHDTQDVRVSVKPEYLDSKSNEIGTFFIWAYHVTIQNNSDKSIKLVNRHWRIIDEQGGIEEVNGEGVVGDQPIIMPNSGYSYTSGVHLRCPSGLMSGNYGIKKGNGKIIDVKIPTFSLDIPGVKDTVN